MKKILAKPSFWVFCTGLLSIIFAITIFSFTWVQHKNEKEGVIVPDFMMAPPTDISTTTDVISAYEKSGFKVSAIAHDTFSEQHPDLYVVTNRGINDGGCGGMYSPGPCYFFLESQWAGVPPIRYIGTWSSTAGLDEIHFINDDTAEFKTSWGDAGASFEEVWRINIYSGSTTMISRKDTSGN
jgi:hypothetical protein